MIEVWMDIKGFEGRYKVSSKGYVYSIISNKVLKTPSSSSNGYPTVGLRKNNKTKYFTVHRLVAIAFLNIKDGEVVNHLDGDKTNNELCNLEVTTYSGNIKHAHDTNLISKKTGPKRNPNEIRQIRVWLDSGCTISSIARAYRMDRKNIREIRDGRIWKDIT